MPIIYLFWITSLMGISFVIADHDFRKPEDYLNEYREYEIESQRLYNLTEILHSRTVNYEIINPTVWKNEERWSSRAKARFYGKIIGIIITVCGAISACFFRKKKSQADRTDDSEKSTLPSFSKFDPIPLPYVTQSRPQQPCPQPQQPCPSATSLRYILIIPKDKTSCPDNNDRNA